MKISFQPFEEKHFPLLLRWLKEPHVREFWSEPEDESVLREKYLKKLSQRGISPQIIMFVQTLVQNPKVREVIADPDPVNLRAIKAYEKAGFQKSGIMETPNGQAMLMRYIVKSNDRKA